jgi:hypothetical protein
MIFGQALQGSMKAREKSLSLDITLGFWECYSIVFGDGIRDSWLEKRSWVCQMAGP